MMYANGYSQRPNRSLFDRFVAVIFQFIALFYMPLVYISGPSLQPENEKTQCLSDLALFLP